MAYLDREYQSIKGEIDKAWEVTVRNGQFIGGDAVNAFESQLSKYLSDSYIVSCANGTDALLAAYLALDINAGDEVIMPAYGYISAYEMCKLIGAIPVLVDINDYYLIDVKQIENKISSKTKAIVVQHLFGQVANMDPILELRNRYSIKIIEDTAQSIGSNYRWKMAGTIGDIGTLSFFPTKNLGCYGDGGAIITNSQEMVASLSQICKHGQSKKYNHERIGMNSRLDTLQASILSAKLPHLSKWNARRTSIAQIYSESFASLENIATPSIATDSTHTYHQYTIKTQQRDQLQAYLKKRGIQSTIYYPKPIHEQRIHQPEGSYPMSERMACESLSLPISPFLKYEEIEMVIKSIVNWSRNE